MSCKACKSVQQESASRRKQRNEPTTAVANDQPGSTCKGKNSTRPVPENHNEWQLQYLLAKAFFDPELVILVIIPTAAVTHGVRCGKCAVSKQSCEAKFGSETG